MRAVIGLVACTALACGAPLSSSFNEDAAGGRPAQEPDDARLNEDSDGASFSDDAASERAEDAGACKIPIGEGAEIPLVLVRPTVLHRCGA